MKVYKSPLPENSRIIRYPDANYRDCFRCRLQNPWKVSPNQVMAAFWTTSPAWLKFLFRLRDLLVRPFGLKTGEGPSREKLEEALDNGAVSYTHLAVYKRQELLFTTTHSHSPAGMSCRTTDSSAARNCPARLCVGIMSERRIIVRM